MNDTFKAKSKKLSNNKRLFPIPSAYSLENEKIKIKNTPKQRILLLD